MAYIPSNYVYGNVPQGQPDFDVGTEPATVAPLMTLQNAADEVKAANAPQTLTPDIAKNLMWQSMTTGLSNTDVAKYGGYDAIKAAYDKAGGTYSLNDIPQANLNTYAQQVADTGVGNLAVLPLSNERLSDQALVNMQANGIDPSSIDRLKQVYQADLYNQQLAAQTDPLKANFATYLADNNINWDEAKAITAYQDQWGFKPEDIAKVTGFSLPTVNKILGAKNTIIGNEVTSNASNPLAFVNFANQNNLTAKQLADASGGTLTETQAQDYFDKAKTYQGRMQLAAPDAYSQIAKIAQFNADEFYGGKIQDYQVQIFSPLDTTNSGIPKQLDITPAKTEKRVATDDNNQPYEYTAVVEPAKAKNPNVQQVELGDGTVGYQSTTPVNINGVPVYAQYDANGKVIGYIGDDKTRVFYPGGHSGSVSGQWDANGKPITQYHQPGSSGGWLQNTLSDLGPAANVALAVATDGMSLEWQVASQAALQVAQGAPLDQALQNAAASYAGAQVVNIPAVKDIVSGIDSVTLQKMINSGLSSATAAGILNKDPVASALAGATGAAVASVVGNMTKDLDLTPKQAKIVDATATVFTKAKLSGATTEQALQAAINAGGMATAKSVVKGLKAEKSAGLDITDADVASLDTFKYDPDIAQQVINEFKLATSTTSADPGVDVAGSGGGNAAAVSGMKPMLGVTGETSGKIGYNSTEGRYERDITGTTKDGKEYTYKAYYYDDPIKGANVWYAVPGGQIDPITGGSTVESRTRPTFDTDATSTDVSTAGTSVLPTGGVTPGAPNVPGSTNGALNGADTGQPGGVAVNGTGGAGGTKTGGTGTAGAGTGGVNGTGTVGGGGGPGGTGTKTETPTKVDTTTTVAPTVVDKTKQAISAPTSGGSSSSSGYGALPGMLAATSLAAGPITQGKKIMSDLHQLYPQIANIDPKLLALLSGTSTPQQVESANKVPNMPEQAATQAPATKSNNPLSSLVGMLGGKSGADNGCSALASAGLQMLGGGQGALPAFAKGGTVDHNPEFITGTTGHYVKGAGDGQSDSIPAMLADGEYVFDADTVAALGNGSSDAGAKLLDKMRENIRKHKRSAPINKIPPKAKSPLEYLKG